MSSDFSRLLELILQRWWLRPRVASLTARARRICGLSKCHRRLVMTIIWNVTEPGGLNMVSERAQEMSLAENKKNIDSQTRLRQAHSDHHIQNVACTDKMHHPRWPTGLSRKEWKFFLTNMAGGDLQRHCMAKETCGGQFQIQCSSHSARCPHG